MTNTGSIPSDFICPITHDIMENPVLLVEDVSSNLCHFDRYSIDFAFFYFRDIRMKNLH